MGLLDKASEERKNKVAAASTAVAFEDIQKKKF